jgi:ribonuclease P protein component
VRTDHLDVRVLAPSAEPVVEVARVGIIVPRHKHSAVDRNRLKRRLRELARTRLLPTLAPAHVVVRARAEAYDDSFETLARQIDRVGREIARMLNPHTPRDT